MYHLSLFPGSLRHRGVPSFVSFSPNVRHFTITFFFYRATQSYLALPITYGPVVSVPHPLTMVNRPLSLDPPLPHATTTGIALDTSVLGILKMQAVQERSSDLYTLLRPREKETTGRRQSRFIRVLGPGMPKV